MLNSTSKPYFVHICSFIFIVVCINPFNIVYIVGTESLKPRVEKNIMALSGTKLRSVHGKPYSGSPEVVDAYGLGIRISPKGIITFQY